MLEEQPTWKEIRYDRNSNSDGEIDDGNPNMDTSLAHDEQVLEKMLNDYFKDDKHELTGVKNQGSCEDDDIIYGVEIKQSCYDTLIWRRERTILKF